MPRQTLATVSKIITETTLALTTQPSISAAARQLKITPEGVYSRMLKYPEIRETIDSMPRQALDNLKQSSVRASEVLIEKLDTSQSLAAAESILDRVGVGKGPQTAVQINAVGGEMGIVVKQYDRDNSTQEPDRSI